jgi:hypothetical protein
MYLQRIGDLADLLESDVVFASLDMAHIASVEIRSSGECFLRQSSLLPQSPNLLAKPLQSRVGHE